MRLTANQLKMIVLPLMAFDHLASALIPKSTMLFTLLHIPGRIVAPVICFLIAESYFYTSNKSKYMWQLLVFAIISHIPYVMLFHLPLFGATSVMWGLFLSVLALRLIESKCHFFFKLLGFGLILYFSRPADWHYISIFWVINFYYLRNTKYLKFIGFAVIGACLYFVMPVMQSIYLIYRPFVLLAIPLILLYNGKRGEVSLKVKWCMYWFYPAHLYLIVMTTSQIHHKFLAL